MTSHRSASSWYSPAALSYEAEELACSASESASHSMAKETGSGVVGLSAVVTLGGLLGIAAANDGSGIVVNGRIAGSECDNGIANRL